MTDYSQGKIYKVQQKGGKGLIYIGSTCSELAIYTFQRTSKML